MFASVGLFLIPLAVPASSESPRALGAGIPGLAPPSTIDLSDPILADITSTTTSTLPPTTTTTQAAPPVSTTVPHVVTTIHKVVVTTTQPKPKVTTAPKPTTSGNTVTGQASWFSSAPGTCAMMIPPMGTVVTVVNTATGASVTCRVSTRGPTVPGRVIDLAYSVFSAIGNPSSGVVSVRVSW